MTKDGKKSDFFRPDFLVSLGITLAIALAAYIWPPDPQHPFRLNFFSKTITVPIWLAIILVIGIVAATVTFRRRRLPERSDEVCTPNLGPPSSRSASSTLFSSAQKQPAAAAPALGVRELLENRELIIKTDDEVSVKIYREGVAPSTKGLMLRIDNDGIEPITKISVTILDGRTYSEIHKTFRNNSDFSAGRLDFPAVLQPASYSNGQWFVRKEPSKQNLLAVNDSMHEMRWPPNDPSVVQQWQLSLVIKGQHAPRSPNDAAYVFPETKLDVIVLWHREKNEFFIKRT